MRRLALVVLLAALAAPRHARADEPRRKHLWFAVGSSTVLPDFTPGGWVGVGGSGKHWGVRADAWLYATEPTSGHVAVQATRTLGRTGRHMVIDIHFGGGVRWPDVAPVVVAGLGSRIGLQRKGPLYVALDGGVHIDLTELPLPVAFVSILGIGLQW